MTKQTRILLPLLPFLLFGWVISFAINLFVQDLWVAGPLIVFAVTGIGVGGPMLLNRRPASEVKDPPEERVSTDWSESNPAQLEPYDPYEVDEIWTWLIGIPVSLWTCWAGGGFNLRGDMDPEKLAYLVRRRDVYGDFVKPVDLAKPFQQALDRCKKEQALARAASYGGLDLAYLSAYVQPDSCTCRECRGSGKETERHFVCSACHGIAATWGGKGMTSSLCGMCGGIGDRIDIPTSDPVCFACGNARSFWRHSPEKAQEAGRAALWHAFCPEQAPVANQYPCKDAPQNSTDDAPFSPCGKCAHVHTPWDFCIHCHTLAFEASRGTFPTWRQPPLTSSTQNMGDSVTFAVGAPRRRMAD